MLSTTAQGHSLIINLTYDLKTILILNYYGINKNI